MVEDFLSMKGLMRPFFPISVAQREKVARAAQAAATGAASGVENEMMGVLLPSSAGWLSVCLGSLRGCLLSGSAPRKYRIIRVNLSLLS